MKSVRNWDTETAKNCRLPELLPGICKGCRDDAYCHRQLSFTDMEEDISHEKNRTGGGMVGKA